MLSCLSVYVLPNTIPKIISPFHIHNLHKTFSLSTPPSLFLELLPQCMKLPLGVYILLNNNIIVLIPIVLKPDILLHLQVRVYIFPQLLIQHIHSYLLNKTLKNKIHHNTQLFQTCNLHYQQDHYQYSTIHLYLFQDIRDSLISPFSRLLFITYKLKLTITHQYLLTII